jgi:hypothetical protein
LKAAAPRRRPDTPATPIAEPLKNAALNGALSVGRPSAATMQNDPAAEDEGGS